MARLTPFADDSASVSIGKMTVENGIDCVALYGSLDLTHDQQGLQHALALKALLDQVVDRLEGTKDLPNAIPDANPAKSLPNPFG